MVPQFEDYYGLTDLRVSFVFLVWPVGYVVAAYLNSVIHIWFGQRGIAAIGPLFHIIFTAAASLHTTMYSSPSGSRTRTSIATTTNWIIVFMQRVNHASDYLASLSSSGFWIGRASHARGAGRHARDPSLPSSGFRPIGRHASDLVRISKITTEHTTQGTIRIDDLVVNSIIDLLK
ncbi:hypothetical protein F5Y00DRAFT_267500 [Daldinia vernicosa]|uniref:uncharacterized protein n=1 Tax=Daldinia vernicosa TaxID=114800 RepID=UPI00200734AF|nr:uncharacterized protein F5Y00DRAFT_267500 [Daldinia vernicosa]KAI0854279.1 hypothetical protein F5Y00DRAFT_267500 [Daldinia vernicosa]